MRTFFNFFFSLKTYEQIFIQLLRTLGHEHIEPAFERYGIRVEWRDS